MLLAEFVKTSSGGSFELRRSYLWGLDVDGSLGGAGGVGGLLWVADYVPGQATSNRQLAPWYDGNGNVMGWMENDGLQPLPQHRLEYDPYGKLLVDDTVRPTRNKKQRDLGVSEAWLERPAFAFSTKYEDAETGLLYYGYRYYAPEMGRWISRDPIAERGGVNLYGMVSNDSINYVDYYGLHELTVSESLVDQAVDWVAWKAAQDAFSKGVSNGKEWGGQVCKICCGGGVWKLFSTGPSEGLPQGYYPTANVVVRKTNRNGQPIVHFLDLCPQGSEAVASYHSHPGYGVGPSSADHRRFRQQDRHNFNRQNYVNNPFNDLIDVNQIAGPEDPEYVIYREREFKLGTNDPGDVIIAKIPNPNPFDFIKTEPKKPNETKCNK